MIISGAEPFFLQGGKHGVLLIHGFTGNPAELLLLGQYLQFKNYTVLGLRLAGHGTDEKDLLRTTCDDWFNSVLDGLAILKNCCEKISVIGHSMGSLLALKLAMTKAQDIHKLITLAAPIFINKELGLKNLPPRENCLSFAVKNSRRKLKDVPPAVNKVYRKMPLIAIHELLDLINEIKTNLPTLETPILIVHGKKDHTANVESANYIFKNITSNKKNLQLIDNVGHLLPLDISCRDKIFALTADFLKD